jgi:hypothetical protein
LSQRTPRRTLGRWRRRQWASVSPTYPRRLAVSATDTWSVRRGAGAAEPASPRLPHGAAPADLGFRRDLGPVRCAGVHVQLGGHAGLVEAQRVAAVLVAESRRARRPRRTLAGRPARWAARAGAAWAGTLSTRRDHRGRSTSRRRSTPGSTPAGRPAGWTASAGGRRAGGRAGPGTRWAGRRDRRPSA